MSDLAAQPASRLVDPVTLRAVQQFFENGGREAKLFGLCIETEDDLTSNDPFSVLWHDIIDRLREREDVGLLTMPVLAYLPVTFDTRGRAVVPCQPTIELLLEHCCEMNNRFLILDTPKDLHEEALFDWVGRFRDQNQSFASYAALYYPWLMRGDTMFPPSGCVAGVYARVESDDHQYGVRNPPANRVLRGVTHPAIDIKWSESDRYLEERINPILTQPARGVVIWGARTLSWEEKWMHINSRRIVSLIAEQLRRDSEWVVFENQRPELWGLLERGVKNRLDDMWVAGLLTGDQAGSEYMVQCDGELNPPEVRDAGQVNVRVTVRPISTAEFIVVDLRLGQ
ncbi:MAG: phage tail sheath subtilisin-like domain-containing protein [Myxococcota bacterium]